MEIVFELSSLCFSIFGAMTQGKQGEYIGNNFLIIIIIITVPASSWVNGKRKNRNGKVRKMGKKKRTKVNYKRFTQTARKILIWSIFYFQFSSISFFPFTFTRSANLQPLSPSALTRWYIYGSNRDYKEYVWENANYNNFYF